MKEKIGFVIKEIRKNKKISQYKLALISGLSMGYISHIESGHYSISVDALKKIADALGVPAWEILKRVEDESE